MFENLTDLGLNKRGKFLVWDLTRRRKKEGENAMASLPECACPILLGRPCHIDRASVISGRKERRIYELKEKIARYQELAIPLADCLTVITDWQMIRFAYLRAIEHGKSGEPDGYLQFQILCRLIQLSETDEQLSVIADWVPCDSGPIECWYLGKVIKICPGE